jgi:NAD(P)-dependent dehydrogenase (short-subunit alcohol dehydrogenase family)
MSHSSNKGVAVVTGASSGIGAVHADRLAKRGYDLILVARNEARLKSLSARLTSETGRSVKVLRADLNNKEELATIEATLRNDSSITMLVNNAGTASVAPLLNADVDKMDEIISLNITALTRLTYAAAPAFVARGAGTIINIGSVVGVSPEALILPLFFVAAPVSFLFPVYTAPVLLAGVVQSYVSEEWLHYALHFSNSRFPLFRRMKKYHLYHHSPRGIDKGYGITTRFWDGVFDTRFPEAVRRSLSKN